MDEKIKTILGAELFAQVAEVLAAHPEVKLADVAEGYIPIAEHERIKGELEATAATTSADLANTQLQLQQAKNDWESEKKGILLAAAIEKGLMVNKAKSVQDFEGRLDRSQIKLENGKLIGFDEQIQQIRANAPYLFEDLGATAPPLNTGASTTTQLSFDDRVDAAAETLLK